jgi:GR25 family glycosyltransferase involved in LPS biosynthesis
MLKIFYMVEDIAKERRKARRKEIEESKKGIETEEVKEVDAKKEDTTKLINDEIKRVDIQKTNAIMIEPII